MADDLDELTRHIAALKADFERIEAEKQVLLDRLAKLAIKEAALRGKAALKQIRGPGADH